jgi:Flp pilus assembly protein TadD
MSYMALYIISMHIVNSNSRSGSSSSNNHWKLNLSTGKVEPAKTEPETANSRSNSKQSSTTNSEKSSKDSNNKYSEKSFEDRMTEILTNKVTNGDGEWTVSSPDTDGSFFNNEDKNCELIDKNSSGNSGINSINSKKCSCTESKGKPTQQKPLKTNTTKTTEPSVKASKTLTCGKKINSTQYDHLRGISDRHLQLHVPEPDVAMVFQSNGKSSEVDMNELEQKLRRAKRDVEKAGPSQREQSAHVYNLIGNFWRIKGNTQNSIECFRKALGISPEDPDILLNLARVLFNLQYLDDAIFLARRSLHLQPSGHNSWLQHYTLGEILKSYGHLQEAALHFHHALELNPGFQPARSHLRDLDSEPSPSVTHLTLLIILFLVVGVLFGVITSVETNFQDAGLGDGSKTQQRHFNRAMAMRSIKLGINPRICRLRKINY